MSAGENPYLPVRARIEKITQETFSPDLDVKTYRLKITGDGVMKFMPGQFVEFSIPGTGECPFGFSSSPLNGDYFEITIKRTGRVTEMIHSLREGDFVWIRGPFGNTFPLKKMEGGDLLFIAGGLGLAPLRPFILYALDTRNRAKYGGVEMLLAARTGKDHCFVYEYDDWAKNGGANIRLTIDRQEEGWNGLVGFPHILIRDIPLDLSNCHALLCGPPMMIKAVQGVLMELGMPAGRLYTTLEMRMTCGVGKCGKCNIGRRYVCVDGPVFSMEELAEMPPEY
ncbi:MAG: FAD/NAD(P)-binding protein [Synergistaceae bacterium]|jgi:NAD(P)H-flavin reductase|nr:FAD/NAD(P)-binding protein [Synergistaceae bacterium]